MGCCACIPSEVQCAEVINLGSLTEENNSDCFNDLNISSDSDMPPLKEWIDYKNTKIFTESTAVFSSINYNSNKTTNFLKVSFKQSSIIDSFSYCRILCNGMNIILFFKSSAYKTASIFIISN